MINPGPGVAMTGDDQAALNAFQGITRLFPLPNVVLFPQVLLPLHIFEPRYRQMTAEALNSDRLISMALLRPGWELDYEGRPPLYATACLGRIVTSQQLADGRYNLLLRGLARVRILEELPPEKLFRQARVQVLTDVPVTSPLLAGELRQELEQLMTVCFHVIGLSAEQQKKILTSDLSLGGLVDFLGFALPFGIEFKQELLEELSMERRARLLIAGLQALLTPSTSQRAFPPDFSSN